MATNSFELHQEIRNRVWTRLKEENLHWVSTDIQTIRVAVTSEIDDYLEKNFEHIYNYYCFEQQDLVQKPTVKPEITHTLGGHQKLWVITGYGFSQVYLHMCYKSWWTQNAMGYHRLWVITVWVISGLTVRLI